MRSYFRREPANFRKCCPAKTAIAIWAMSGGMPWNWTWPRRGGGRKIADRSVVVYPKGVWDKDAILPLRVSSGLSSLADTVVLSGDQTLAQVPLTTIDKLVQELALPRVDMIKMDIEGAERQA